MWDHFLEKLGFVTRILGYIAAAALFLMMLLTTVDVGGRYLFQAPIMGVYELTEFMMVCVVFFSLAYTQSRKGHVEVDILVGRFPKRVQEALTIVNYIVSILVFAPILGAINEEDIENLEDLLNELPLIYPIIRYILRVEKKILDINFLHIKHLLLLVKKVKVIIK